MAAFVSTVIASRKRLGFATSSEHFVSAPRRGGQTVVPPQSRSRATTPTIMGASALTNAVFDFANFYALPVWAFLLLAPKSKITKKIVLDPLAVIPLAMCYLYCVLVADPADFNDLTPPFTIDKISSLFSVGGAATGAAWIHYLVTDLMVGRWVTIDGMERNVFAKHSIFLSFLFGPLGLLSHMGTRLAYSLLRREGTESKPEME